MTGHSMFFRALVHSFIISVIFYILEFHVSKYLPLNKKIKPLVIAIIAAFLGMNISFLAFNYFYHWTEMYWSSYWPFLYEYPMIIAIPVILSLLIDKLLIPSLMESNGFINISSENEKDQLLVKRDNLLFVKSDGNYIEVFHRSSQKTIKNLFRKTLKELETEQLSNPYLFRCHRSYMINPSKIEQVSKSKGKLEIHISDTIIPVSKKYAEILNKKYPDIFITDMDFSSHTP